MKCLTKMLSRKYLKNNRRVYLSQFYCYLWGLHCNSAGNNGNSAVTHVSRVMIFPDCSPINLRHCSSPGMEQAGHSVKEPRHFDFP